MIEEIKRFENSISKFIQQKFTNITQDQESKEYCGYNFEIDKLNFKFRKAKITPKKIGQFVTLWKRNSDNQTEPFSENENFDFYIIVTEQKEKYGFFIFPKRILCEKQVLKTNHNDGKRGFRIYPDWKKPENKQAEKTQSWQTNYFIDLTSDEDKNIEKFKLITNL